MKNKLIKLLGGYTKKEMFRVEQKCQALLDSKTNSDTAFLINEYVWRLLKDLDQYMSTIYKDSSWGDKLYNVIHNNMFRIMIRYVHVKSSTIYKLDTTLDSKDEFINVLKNGKEYDELETLLASIPEND